ncbi:MAG: dicarboxylate/amino acid:cation symporter [Verrucomicrobiaceae bacterium]|nr:dicarboxylate/amino acid:cation symporter [Verrucomicrobiaceae bacterium]
MTDSPARKPWYQMLYVQVLIGVALGVTVGHFFPEPGKSLEPLGKGFIALVKMLIAPIIFCTVVHGIASMGDLKKLGRVGGKALLYFEVVSTFALIVGLVVVNWLQPGANFQPKPASAKDMEKVANFQKQAETRTSESFLLDIIPTSYVSAFTGDNLLQVLLVAVLTAFAIAGLGDRGTPILRVIDQAAPVFFGILNMIIKLAPIGAFGAMAFTVGSFGVKSLGSLAELMLGFYATAIFFVLVVLGSIARFCGFSIFRFLAFIKDELLLVLGTSSSETALPGMMAKMKRLGCSDSTVGLVIPTGYSFNLDGTNIYMTMAAIFLAQATHTPMTLSQQLWLLFVAMLTSKGASGVTGAGFITLAATLAAVPGIPLESLAYIIGIDRFMSECRSLTNLVGNGLATVVISRWEGEVTGEEVRRNLAEGTAQS